MITTCCILLLVFAGGTKPTPLTNGTTLPGDGLRCPDEQAESVTLSAATVSAITRVRRLGEGASVASMAATCIDARMTPCCSVDVSERFCIAAAPPRHETGARGRIKEWWPMISRVSVPFRFRTAYAALAVAAFLAGCGPAGITLRPASIGAELPGGSFEGGGTAASPQSGKIQHVVIIMQENRSFDNLFQGYPGANTVSSGKNSKGQTIALQPVSLASEYGIDHNFATYLSACNGTGSLPGTKCKMNGFDNEVVYGSQIPANP